MITHLLKALLIPWCEDLTPCQCSVSLQLDIGEDKCRWLGAVLSVHSGLLSARHLLIYQQNWQEFLILLYNTDSFWGFLTFIFASEKICMQCPMLLLTMRLKAHFFLIFLFAAGVRVWRGADDVCWLCLTQRDRMQLTKWIPPLRSRIKSLHSLLWGTGPELSEKTFLPILWDGLLRFGGFWLLTRSKVWQQQGTFSTKCH